MSFPGVQTSRDGFLVDTDLDRLKARVGDYFDSASATGRSATLSEGDEVHVDGFDEARGTTRGCCAWGLQ